MAKDRIDRNELADKLVETASAAEDPVRAMAEMVLDFLMEAEVTQKVGAGKYDVTAMAMIALLKYGAGMPFNRMERLEAQLGIPFPAATQWELTEPAADSLEPIWGELIRHAAQGGVVHNDNTGMRILKLVRRTDDGRTGTFTSGIVSIWREWRIALYFTGWKHAGENLADVLKRRAAELDAPIQMCDALSRNMPKLPGVEVLPANCLAHGRRQIVDVAANFPEETVRAGDSG